MKNWKRCALVGMVAIIALSFCFVTCDSDPKGDKDLSGNITISPTSATTGTELTATYSGTETINYQWNKGGTAIDGKTTNKFTPTEAGSYTVTVSASGFNSKTSVAVEVTPAPEWKTTGPLSFGTGGSSSRTMTINYMALPNADEPTWVDKLMGIFRAMPGEFQAGNYTLTVTPNGTAGFAADGNGNVTVSETFLSKPDLDIVTSIYELLGSNLWNPEG
jgi:hypothetical protein